MLFHSRYNSLFIISDNLRQFFSFSSSSSWIGNYRNNFYPILFNYFHAIRYSLLRISARIYIYIYIYVRIYIHMTTSHIYNQNANIDSLTVTMCRWYQLAMNLGLSIAKYFLTLPFSIQNPRDSNYLVIC